MYEKPEIQKLDHAIRAIQNPQAKPGDEFYDGVMPNALGTINAYAADE